MIGNIITVQKLYEKIIIANENGDLPTVFLIFGRGTFIMLDFGPIEDAFLENSLGIELGRTYTMITTLSKYWIQASTGQLTEEDNLKMGKPLVPAYEEFHNEAE